MMKYFILLCITGTLVSRFPRPDRKQGRSIPATEDEPEPTSITGANMTSTDTDYAGLDDPELFEERRRVREELAALPKHHADRGRLSRALEALTEEFDRRARSAWRS